MPQVKGQKWSCPKCVGVGGARGVWAAVSVSASGAPGAAVSDPDTLPKGASQE